MSRGRGMGNSDKIAVNLEPIGDRPAGSQPPDAPIIQAAILALRSVGLTPLLEEPESTDANVAISLGIPAMTVGRGGVTGDNHSINEWYDPKDAYVGPQKNPLTVLALVGVEGVSKPVLAKAAARK